MYRNVLLTLDGSPLALTAIPHAANVAGSDASIHVVEVVPTRDQLRRDLQGSAYEFTVEGNQSVDDLVETSHFQQRDGARERLAAAEQALHDAGVRQVSTEVREGYPGNEILTAAAERGSDVIVMATRGHSGLGREVVGSVAEYVLRHAGAAAVLLVGPRAHATEGRM